MTRPGRATSPPVGTIKTIQRSTPTSDVPVYHNPWPVLWALVIGFFMILVDNTIVSVATPAILADLRTDVNSAVSELLLPMALLGLGNAFLWAALSATATRGLPMGSAGAGAGVYNTTRQVGAVIGSAAWWSCSCSFARSTSRHTQVTDRSAPDDAGAQDRPRR